MAQKKPLIRRSIILVMYLLDSDILIWILRNNKNVVNQISQLKKKSELAISVISIAEIYRNIFPSEIVETEQFIKRHIIFDVDTQIAKMAGFYWQEYHKNLQNLSLTDCLIAATANTNSATLVSLNTKHFPMKDIRLLNPLA